MLSDAPRHDQYWLDRLFEAANMQLRAPKLQYVSHAFEGTDIDEIAFHNGEKKLTRKRTHRALQDALDWAELYLACSR
ncbi:MAG: hypothetical protein HWE25_08455 [Alphaproteobacteria bacterium]|nr:hypothetical protein [Alphaproteobacteria bacterium]